MGYIRSGFLNFLCGDSPSKEVGAARRLPCLGCKLSHQTWQNPFAETTIRTSQQLSRSPIVASTGVLKRFSTTNKKAIQTDASIDWSPSRLPQHVDILLKVRTGQIKTVFATNEQSAIFKTPLVAPVKVGPLGSNGAEQVFEIHGSVDKALMQYFFQHYALWKKEFPRNADLFTVGGFGENLVASNMSEATACIGDSYQLGKDL